jgi:hypothetical protein
LYPHPDRNWHLSRTQQLHADGCLPLPARRALLSLSSITSSSSGPGYLIVTVLPNYSRRRHRILSEILLSQSSSRLTTHDSRLIIEDCPVLESCAALTTSLTRIASHFARLPLRSSQINNSRLLANRHWGTGTRRRSRIEGLRSHSPPRRAEGTGRTDERRYSRPSPYPHPPPSKVLAGPRLSIPQIHPFPSLNPFTPLLLPPHLLFCSSTSPDILLSGNLFLISAPFDGEFVIATWPPLTKSLCGLPLSGPFR